jgi:hypothetical protein
MPRGQSSGHRTLAHLLATHSIATPKQAKEPTFPAESNGRLGDRYYNFMRQFSVLFFIALFMWTTIQGQAITQAQKNSTTPSRPSVNNVTVNNPDTLTVVLSDKIQFPGKFQIETINNSDWTDQMPWIVALLIGVISVVITIVIGKNQIKSSERTLNRQIETSKEIAKLDFNKIVISGNRQEWINRLRDNLSEYLAKTETYSIALLNPSNTAERLQELINERLSDILALEVKIVLMLNSTEEDSKQLIKFLGIYTKCIFGEAITQPVEVLKQNIIDITKQILKTEWERVKKGE